MDNIQFALVDDEILNCFPIMSLLRPHLAKNVFLEKVKKQQNLCNYHLAYIENEEEIIQAVVGFRFSEGLAWGKFVYIDDLVTDPDKRSKGYGAKLIDWVILFAKEHECDEIHLDSGVQRFDAHRFYLQKRFAIKSHHFSINLK
ncbi:MAG: GNAT superfamily N-acetyltransferase [bacterium]|jgi:GNAT superfamily N-acetyltransferase